MGLKVEELLSEKGIPYRLIKLIQKAYTVSDVVRYSEGDVNPEEICKTIIIKGKKSGKKIGILLRGVDKIDFTKAKKLFGEEITVASPEEVQEVAGVDPGAVCPFLLTVPLFVDGAVLKLPEINCGSGDHLYGLEFETKDLVNALSYEVESFAKTLV